MGETPSLRQIGTQAQAAKEATAAEALMPYKSHEDELANRRHRKHVERRQLWQLMGLEEIGPTHLICLTCRKESHKAAAHIFRHHEDCPMRKRMLEVLHRTEDDLAWSRRPTANVQLKLFSRVLA